MLLKGKLEREWRENWRMENSGFGRPLWSLFDYWEIGCASLTNSQDKTARKNKKRNRKFYATLIFKAYFILFYFFKFSCF